MLIDQRLGDGQAQSGAVGTAADHGEKDVFLQIFANPGEHDMKRMLLNMITTSLYLGLPLLWSGMMAWAGVQVGRSINNATAPLARPGEDAGRHGGAMGKAAASRGLRR